MPSALSAGALTVEEGTVTKSGSALTTQTITVNSGATFLYANSGGIVSSAGATCTLNGGTFGYTAGGSGGTFLTANMGIVLNGGGTLSDAIGNPNIYSGVISGTGDLTKVGAGILSITTTCTYSGNTIINNGTLRLRTGTPQIPNTALTVTSPGGFDWATFNQTVQSVSGTGSLPTTGSGTLTIAGTASTTYSGVWSGSGRINVNKSGGTGTLTINGVNTASGQFTVTAGTVTVNSGKALCGPVCDLFVNGGTLNLNNTAQTVENLTGTGGTINLGTGHTLSTDPIASGTCASTIAGAGSLQILNANATTRTLTLTGANTYDGVTTVTKGILSVGSATALGSTVGNTVVASAGPGEVLFTGAGTTFTCAEPFNIAGAGSTDGGAIAIIASAAPTLSGTVTLSADATITISSSASGTFSAATAFSGTSQTLTLAGGANASGVKAITGVIALGTGGVTKLQGGNWGLSGANTYSGPTAVSGGGSLVINSIANVSGGPSSLGAPTSVAYGTIALRATTTSGGLLYTGSGHSSDRVIDLAGTTGGATLDGSGSGAFTLTSPLTASGAGSKTLTLTGTSLSASTLSGAVVDNGGANITALTKSAAGTWVLSGASTYSGATAISGGTLSINTIANVSGGASALGNPATTGNGTIKIGSTTTAATLQYTGSGHSSDRVVDLAGTTGGATLDASGSGALSLTSALTASGAGSKTLTLTGTSTAANTLGGAIVNNSSVNKTAVTKTGAGLWALGGTSTYSGDTTISAGTLVLSGAGSINSSPNIIDNASLDISGHSGGLYTLAGGQTLKGNGGVNGTIVVASGATVAPGTSIGTLYFTNTPTLSGTTAMEINKAAGPLLTSDKLVVVAGGGQLVYGGALTISASGLSLAPGDTFDLFDADSFSGSFTSVTPAPGAGLVWDTSQLTVDGTIKVACNGTLAVAGPNTNTCSGVAVQLGALASGGSGTGYTYSWNPATALSSTTIANPIASPTSTITYTVTVTDSVGCTANSTVTVTTDLAPTISSQPANSTVCSGSTASFSVTASGSGLAYSWAKHDNTGWGSAWSATGGGGTFRFTSTGDNFGDPACTGFSSANDINSPSGSALGMYGGGSGDEVVTRGFPALTSGQVVSIDFDNGNVDGGRKVGFSLQGSGGADVLQFYFTGGGTTYLYNDGTEHDSGIGFQRTGLRVQFRLTSATTYALIVTSCGGTSNAFTGSYSGTITNLALFNQNTSGGGDRDIYFNNFIVGGYVDNADNYSGAWSGLDKGDQPILLGNGNSSYTTPTLNLGDSGTQYEVVVSGCGGSVVSSPAALTVNPPALVDAGADQTVCASSPAVTLAGWFGGAATNATWSGGSGAFSNGDSTTTNATYTPSVGEITAGTVTLTLTTGDPSGPCGAVNDSMMITINPAAVVNAGPDKTVCSSSPAVTLGGYFGGAASSATWTGGAGSFNPNNTATNAVYTPTAGEITVGTVTLTLTTDDPSGPCGAVNDSMVITINPAATVNAGADQTVCGDNPATTLAGSIGGGASSATWAGGAGAFSPNNTTLTAIYTPTAGEIAAGTVTLTLTTDDPTGPCGAVNDSMIITIDRVTATNVTYLRNAGSSVKISKTNLLTHASDSDAETITVLGVGTDGVNLLTTNGVTLTTDADWIFYTNSATLDANDSFLYKVTDTRGCIALGTVFIQVVQNETGQGTSVTVSNGVATVGFAGIPGRSYQVQRSTNLVDWATLVTTNAPGNGVFEWADNFSDLGVPPADPPSSAYYRLRVP